MLIIEIHDVRPESFQRTLDALLDALGAAVLDLLPAGITSDPELRGDHHLCAHRRQGLAHELFVGVRTVDFGGIEECDAAFDGRADERNHRLLVRWDTVALAHPHAAEPQRRHFQTPLSQFAFLHGVSLGLHHHLDCFALVHGAVAVGNLIQSDDPIEYPARLDLALEHIGKQLLNVRSYRGWPAADREIVVERRLRGGDRLVMRDADAAHGATGTGNPNRGTHRFLSADALNDGVDAEAAGQRAHALDRALAALAHDVRCAEPLRQGDPVGMAAHHDNLLGAEAPGGDDGAEADGAVTDNGRGLAAADLGGPGRMMARSH